MCSSEFSKILVGEERLILCRKTSIVSLREAQVKSIIKKAFPELFVDQKFFREKEIKFSIECCHKMFSGQFDCQVYSLEAEHDWDEVPFVALELIQKDGKMYCMAAPFI